MKREDAGRAALSMPEEKVWELINGNKLGCRFRRKTSVAGVNVSFYCVAARLVVIVESPANPKTVHQAMQKLRHDGFACLFFDGAEAYLNTLSVVERIKEAVKVCLVRPAKIRPDGSRLSPVDGGRISVPVLSRENLEKRAEASLRRWAPSVLSRPGSTPILEIAEALSSGGQCRFDFRQNLGDRDGKKILGRFSPKHRIIWIDRSILDDLTKLRFTLAHEIGHYELHLPCFEEDSHDLADGDDELVLDREFGSTATDWLEWQANNFAAALLTPRAMFSASLMKIQVSLGIRRPGTVYLDSQPDNVRDFNAIVKELERKFLVSFSVVRIRLQNLGLLFTPTAR